MLSRRPADPGAAAAGRRRDAPLTRPAWAELYCCSAFSFGHGAAMPEELVARAAALGYRALALTDECSQAGAVRAWAAAREHGLQLIHGSLLRLEPPSTRPGHAGLRLLALVPDADGWAELGGLITTARRRAGKGCYRLLEGDLPRLQRCLMLWLPDPQQGAEVLLDDALRLAGLFPGRLWLALACWRDGLDDARRENLAFLAGATGLPRLAVGGALFHEPRRKYLHDVITAVRLGRPVAELGRAMLPNDERCLREPARLVRLFEPELVAETLRVAARCRFDLGSLRYSYPDELVPEGWTASAWLARLTDEGLERRCRGPAPAPLRARVDEELAIIAELAFEPYFLTVHDLVRFARSRGILCQGRGSAANSAVCWALGITEVDPRRSSMLFGRFISRERGEPPDIDVDFEHERREEVLQYLFERYGRDRAALTCTVIRYRPASALRDVGRALGLAEADLHRLARVMRDRHRGPIEAHWLAEAGLAPESATGRRLLFLANEILGLPRHLSQHVGGMVISREPLWALVPVENAAMARRTVIQCDKDDLDALGLLKIDVLALGMLTVIRRALATVSAMTGRPLALADIPAEDGEVYRMISRGDTLGVFQIESRAQMAMLPRSRPTCFYDLVIEVAIVRPGPIQGGMVHPYLRRRQGLEAVDYPGPAVRRVLERTLGVPIFQEQVMELAMVAAGFSAGEADQLRRAMAAWRRRGGLEAFETRLVEGMTARGYDETFARQLYAQIQGFAEYGFPESHAASFALLVYVSAWLRCHHPLAYAAALLDSQPMGFYAPAQIVADARRHGVTVLPVDVGHSGPSCRVEETPDGPALRLGLDRVRGLSAEGVRQVVAGQPWVSMEDFQARCPLGRRDATALARAGALASLSPSRREALWAAAGSAPPRPIKLTVAGEEARLPRLSELEEIIADHAGQGLSLRRHPLAVLRPELRRRGYVSGADLGGLEHGRLVAVAGLVLVRQRPGTAAGVTFLTLEDEHGFLNVVVWRDLAQARRRVLLDAGLLGVQAILERQGSVIQLVARHLSDLTELLGGTVLPSRDFQ